MASNRHMGRFIPIMIPRSLRQHDQKASISFVSFVVSCRIDGFGYAFYKGLLSTQLDHVFRNAWDIHHCLEWWRAACCQKASANTSLLNHVLGVRWNVFSSICLNYCKWHRKHSWYISLELHMGWIADTNLWLKPCLHVTNPDHKEYLCICRHISMAKSFKKPFSTFFLLCKNEPF